LWEQIPDSKVDNRSHERGYPALLDISGGPVGALVLARDALAGDVWTQDRVRRPVSETVVVGRNLRRVHPADPAPPPRADPDWDRQVRWLGDRGQELLSRVKVGVVGAGGVGSPLITMLARLGVGHIVVIDPDRVDPTNLPRLAEARRLDAMAPLHRLRLGGLAKRLSTPKVRLARRAVRRANPNAHFDGVRLSVVEPEAAHALVDCDFLFLAADSHLARRLFNTVCHQFLIPGIQLGTRIEVDADSGRVIEIRSHARLVLPFTGCLRCNGLISPTRLQDEARGPADRERNRYAQELPAPSVITFNHEIAARAVSDFLLMLVGLVEASAPLDYLRLRPTERRWEPVRALPNKAACPDCGTTSTSRRSRGDSRPLPLPERSSRE